TASAIGTLEGSATAAAIVASQGRNDSSAKGDASMDLMINGERRQIDVPSDMPVLWVLRDVLGMTGTKFGCGMSLCGACTVHLDGQAIRSCVTPVSTAAGKAVISIGVVGAKAVGHVIEG